MMRLPYAGSLLVGFLYSIVMIFLQKGGARALPPPEHFNASIEDQIYFELRFSQLFEPAHPDLALRPSLFGPDDLTLAHAAGCTWLRNVSGVWEEVDSLPPYREAFDMSACRLTRTPSEKLFLWVSYFYEDGAPANNAVHIHAVIDDVISRDWHQPPLPTSAVTAITDLQITDQLIVSVLSAAEAMWYQWSEDNDVFAFAGNQTLVDGQAIDMRYYDNATRPAFWLLMADNAEFSPLREWDGEQFVPFNETLPGPARSITGCPWQSDWCAWVADYDEDFSELWCWDVEESEFALRTILYGQSPQHTECIAQDDEGVYVWHLESDEATYFRCPYEEPFICEPLVEDLPGGFSMAALPSVLALISAKDDEEEREAQIQELRIYTERYGIPPVEPVGMLSIVMPKTPPKVNSSVGEVNITGSLIETTTLSIPWRVKESLTLRQGSYQLSSELFNRNGKHYSARFLDCEDGSEFELGMVDVVIDQETLVCVKYKYPKKVDLTLLWLLVLVPFVAPLLWIIVGDQRNELRQRGWRGAMHWRAALSYAVRHTLPPSERPPPEKALSFQERRRCKSCGEKLKISKRYRPRDEPSELKLCHRLCHRCRCSHYDEGGVRCEEVVHKVYKKGSDGRILKYYYFCATHLTCQEVGCNHKRRWPVTPFCNVHKCRMAEYRFLFFSDSTLDHSEICREKRKPDGPYCEDHSLCSAHSTDAEGNIIGTCDALRSVRTSLPVLFCDAHLCKTPLHDGKAHCSEQACGKHHHCISHLWVCREGSCEARIPWRRNYCYDHQETEEGAREEQKSPMCLHPSPCGNEAAQGSVYCADHRSCKKPGCDRDRLPPALHYHKHYAYCDEDTCPEKFMVLTQAGQFDDLRCNSEKSRDDFCEGHAGHCSHCKARHPLQDDHWGMMMGCFHQCAFIDREHNRRCEAPVVPKSSSTAVSPEYERFCERHLPQEKALQSFSFPDDADDSGSDATDQHDEAWSDVGEEDDDENKVEDERAALLPTTPQEDVYSLEQKRLVATSAMMMLPIIFEIVSVDFQYRNKNEWSIWYGLSYLFHFVFCLVWYFWWRRFWQKYQRSLTSINGNDANQDEKVLLAAIAWQFLSLLLAGVGFFVQIIVSKEGGEESVWFLTPMVILLVLAFLCALVSFILLYSVKVPTEQQPLV